jgi:hypothetical protein
MPDAVSPDTAHAADLLSRIIAEVRGEAPYRYSMRYTRTLATVPPDRPALMSGFPARESTAPTTEDWWLTAERESSRRVRIQVTRPAHVQTPPEDRESFWMVAHDDDAYYSVDGEHWGALNPSQATYASQLPLMMTSFDDTLDQASESAVADAEGHVDLAGVMGESFKSTVARLVAYDQPGLLNAFEAADGRFHLRVADDDPQTVRERVYLTGILGRREIAGLAAGSDVDAEEFERRIPADFRQRYHLEIEFAPTDFGEPIEVARPEIDPRMPTCQTVNEVPDYNPVADLLADDPARFEPLAATAEVDGAEPADLPAHDTGEAAGPGELGAAGGLQAPSEEDLATRRIADEVAGPESDLERDEL